jgi:hypothetical protein
MKSISLGIILSVILLSVQGQYYYKDILLTKELMDKQQLYRQNKVKSVNYLSFDAGKQPIEGFSCRQEVNSNFTEITTSTTTSLSGASENRSFFNNRGQLIKTIDTTDGNKTVTEYTYTTDGKIAAITSLSTSPGEFILREQHYWSYNQQGKPEKMLKIKNNTDTTHISFVLDEKANVAEEKSVHKNSNLPTVYYYYDDQNRITDVVRYNNRAKRLLPDYIFEYENNRLSTMLVAEEGSSDYQKWYYSYDEDGLKIQDACYSKTKQLIGRVEYEYVYYN